MSKAKWGANNPTLKRDEQKMLRDRVKSGYKKGNKCEICDTEEYLQFHHYQSLTGIWNKWKRKNKIKINGTDEMLIAAKQFISEHQYELLEDTVTLCKYHHHVRLHGIYSKSPNLSSAPKQRRWVGIKRDQFLAGDKV